jgi:hypothetical protein
VGARGTPRPTLNPGSSTPPGINPTPTPPPAQRIQPPPPPAPNGFPRPTPPGATPVSGVLRQAYRSELGRPLYYLTGSDGRLVCWISPQVQNRQDLQKYVNQSVEVTGGPRTFRPDLRGDHMVAQQVKPLAGGDVVANAPPKQP